MTPLDFTRLRYVLGPVLQQQAALQQPGQVLDVLDALMPVIEAEVRALAPASLAAVQAVLDLHRPMSWHEECMTSGDLGRAGWRYAKTYGWCLVRAEDHFAVGDDGLWTCSPRRIQDRCVECTPDYDPQEGVVHPCATADAIAAHMIPSSPSAPTPGGGEAATACAPHMECAERGCYAEAVGLPEQCKRGAA